MNKTLKFTAAAAAAALTLTTFGQGPQMPTPVVSIGKVVEAEDFIGRNYTGRVESSAVVQIVPRVSGEILSVGFKDGDHVKAGQILYQLDPVRYEAQVKSAQGKIAECNAVLKYAEQNFDRGSALYEKQATSKDTLESRVATMDAAKAALMIAEATLITAKEDLKDTQIKAPIDAVAGVTNFTKGNYLTPSSGILVTLVQVKPIRVSFSISTSDYLSMFGSIAAMKKDAHIALTLADGRTLEEDGRIEFMDNQVNKNTDSVRVYAEFPNEKMMLVPGATLTVHLSKKAGQKVAAVNPGAVVHTSSGPCVYVVDAENKVKKTYVVLGNSTSELQFIRSGVKTGETVVTGGTNKIVMDGMTVKPAEAK